MRKKIGTVLDESVVERAKVRAARDGKTLSALIEDALVRYLAEGEDAVARSFGMLKLTPAELEEVLTLDYYDS